MATPPVSRLRTSPKEAELVPIRSLLKLLVLALAEFVPNQARVKLGAVKKELGESGFRHST